VIFTSCVVILAPWVWFWHSACELNTHACDLNTHAWFLHSCVWFEHSCVCFWHAAWKNNLLQYIHKPKVQEHACGRLKIYHPHACRINTLRGIVTVLYCVSYYTACRPRPHWNFKASFFKNYAKIVGVAFFANLFLFSFRTTQFYTII
jgi:hypothetical protein